jgi:hypothetical protein
MLQGNAFVGQKTQPTIDQVLTALGPASTAWCELVGWLAQECGVDSVEWQCHSRLHGWSCKLKHRNRTIVHLGPRHGSFLAMLNIGDRALQAARDSNLSKNLRKALEQAPHYPEGIGLRIAVKSARDLASVKKLAVAKLVH